MHFKEVRQLTICFGSVLYYVLNEGVKMNFARIKMQDRPPLYKLKNKQSNYRFENRECKGEENG